MTVRVCIAIGEETTEAARSAMRRASRWADLVEVRADYIRDLNVRRLLEEKPCTMIFTLRAANEGGRFNGPEETRLKCLVEAAGQGADYVDVEFSTDWRTVARSVAPERIILSYHDFDQTPVDLEARFEAMASTGAGILKVATRARCLRDNARIRRLLESARTRGLRLIALAMGGPGIPSRILGPSWGSWLTFAGLPGGDTTAEGQFDAELMLDTFRVRAIDSKTEVYGVLGNPLAHSLSPLVHNTAFAARKMNALFIPLEAASVDDFDQFHKVCALKGCSVTIPFKEQVRALARTCSPAAEQIGAINTLVRRETGWHGENTDVEGFLRPLRERLDMSGLRAVVLGSGGAARAAVYGLRSHGVSVCVVARNYDKASALAGRFKADSATWSELPRLRWNLLVNATPVGMYPKIDESPVAPEWLTGEWVYDLIYNPARTRLLVDAAEGGCKTIDGTEMFLGQALRQQQLWFGEQGPEEAMHAALTGALRAALF